MVRDREFQYYDYTDPELNENAYGPKYRLKPPRIELEKIAKMPIAIFAGSDDDFTSPRDTRWLRSMLSTVQQYEEIDSFDHGSFMVGLNMSYLKNLL
mmetsp:Transcript_36079/g.55401  ORF Transcript_36079/g.55401 Transcript_36079/m.55401 type:complete len:97 (+) Transcript_36079:1255-1545(+)